MEAFDDKSVFDSMTAGISSEWHSLHDAEAELAWSPEPRPVPAWLDPTPGRLTPGHIALMGDFENS